MRYVFYAVAAVAAMISWLNVSSDGKSIKRQLMEHPEEPARLY